MRVSTNDLCSHYGIDRRTVQRWLSADPPVPSVLEKGARVFDSVIVFNWFTERAARKAINDRDRAEPANVTEIRLRYDEVRTKLKEIELSVRQGKMITLEAHCAAIVAVCERLRAALINLPSAFAHQLEQSGISAADAERVLIEIADDITASLRKVADDMLAADRSEQNQ